MQFNEIVERLKRGQAGVVDFKIKNNPIILTAASLEKANENEISFLDNNSQLILKNHIKTSKASALLLPADDNDISKIANKLSVDWIRLKDPKIGFVDFCKLKVNNVITIEPGLYYPNLGACRIEDVVLVQKNI